MLRGAQDGNEVDTGSRTLLVPTITARLAWVTYAVGFLVLALGTIVTGSGPHSGDADAPARTGFDPRRSTSRMEFIWIRPTRIQAWREEKELPDRDLMRDGAWLA